MAENTIHKGLVGVLADETAVSKVDPEKRRLTYRGYPVISSPKNARSRKSPTCSCTARCRTAPS